MYLPPRYVSIVAQIACVPVVDLAEQFDQEQAYEDLKSAYSRVSKQLERSKRTKAELVEAVYLGARDAATARGALKVPKPPKDSRKASEEIAAVVLGDWQLGKRTSNYNTEVCEERINRLADKVERLVAIQRQDHPVKELRIWCVGDLVEGELIFPGQHWTLDSSLFRQVITDGPRILGNFITRMLAIFDRVKVVGVIGNHGAIGGRSRRDMHPESNGDRMMLNVVRQLFESEERVVFEIPDDEWYAVDNVGEKGFLLFHGNQIRGQSGIPWYGYTKKVLGWATGSIPEKFEYTVSGHYHQACSFPLNKIMNYVSGSTESNNSYAQEQLAASGDPSQWLFFIHPKHGITAEHRVWLNQ